MPAERLDEDVLVGVPGEIADVAATRREGRDDAKADIALPAGLEICRWLVVERARGFTVWMWGHRHRMKAHHRRREGCQSESVRVLTCCAAVVDDVRARLRI